MKQKTSHIALILLFLFSTIFTGVANSSHIVSEDNPIVEYEGWKLVWSEEFDISGALDEDIWSYEEGFTRNEELQWYQKENAYCEDGLLKITGKKERVENPNYNPESTSWKENREYAEYTSSSITTLHSKSWTFGRFEIKARIPINSGSWPGIWAVGTVDKNWPSSGEIDIMEFYQRSVLANIAWGSGTAWTPQWDSSRYPLTHFTDDPEEWGDEFHLWRMDWDKDYIRIYMDDMENPLKETDLSKTINPNENGFNPFHHPQYFLLSFALGGNGGTPDDEAFPLVYEVDYVRIYQVNEDSSLDDIANNASREVEYVSENNSLNVFMDEKSIDSEAIISIYNINGACLYETHTPTEKTMSISLKTKPEVGVYIVRIAAKSGGVTAHKVVVF